VGFLAVYRHPFGFETSKIKSPLRERERERENTSFLFLHLREREREQKFPLLTK
jgi:hypothetical protein